MFPQFSVIFLDWGIDIDAMLCLHRACQTNLDERYNHHNHSDNETQCSCFTVTPGLERCRILDGIQCGNALLWPQALCAGKQ